MGVRRVAAPAARGVRESDILHAIMVALSAVPGCLVRRQNVGLAALKNRAGYIRFGVAGQADLSVIYRGRAIEIEVKTASGAQSDLQRDYQRAVERAGGLYVVARSVADAMRALGAPC